MTRPLAANVQILHQLLVAPSEPVFPRTAATDVAAALSTIATTTLCIPRGTPGYGAAYGPLWWAGAGGVISDGSAGAVVAVTPTAGAFVISPDGRWAFVSTGANVLHAYPVVPDSVNSPTSTGVTIGAAITAPVSAPTVGTIVSIDVSPDGRFVAIAGGTSPFIEAYAFDPVAGAWGAKAAAPGVLPAGAGKSVRFSPDQTMLALGHATSPFVSLYAWAGAFGNKAANPATLPAAQVSGIAWHPGSGYLACAVNTADATLNNRTYPITGGATPAFGAVIAATSSTASAAMAVDWTPGGEVLALAISATVVNFWPFSAGTFGARYVSTALLFGGGGGDRPMAFGVDGLRLWFLSVNNTTISHTALLPASTFVPPGATRYGGPLSAPPVAAGSYAASGVIRLALNAGEVLFIQGDQANLSEVVLSIAEYGV